LKRKIIGLLRLRIRLARGLPLLVEDLDAVPDLNLPRLRLPSSFTTLFRTSGDDNISSVFALDLDFLRLNAG